MLIRASSPPTTSVCTGAGRRLDGAACGPATSMLQYGAAPGVLVLA